MAFHDSLLKTIYINSKPKKNLQNHQVLHTLEEIKNHKSNLTGQNVS